MTEENESLQKKEVNKFKRQDVQDSESTWSNGSGTGGRTSKKI